MDLRDLAEDLSGEARTLLAYDRHVRMQERRRASEVPPPSRPACKGTHAPALHTPSPRHSPSTATPSARAFASFPRWFHGLRAPHAASPLSLLLHSRPFHRRPLCVPSAVVHLLQSYSVVRWSFPPTRSPRVMWIAPFRYMTSNDAVLGTLMYSGLSQPVGGFPVALVWRLWSVFATGPPLFREGGRVSEGIAESRA